MSSTELLQNLLALLRAQYVIYQDAHWEVSGPNFYGQHLMFERLYTSVVDEIDTLAEKMVAMYGPKVVDPLKISRWVTWWVARWSQTTGFLERGIQAEAQFEKLVEATYDQLDGSGELSMGMDDFLMAAINAHETNRYLLRQAQRT